MDASPFITLGIALGLGLLVGLQAERANSRLAGIRTFPLITLAGALAAYLSLALESAWILAAGLLGIALLAFVSNYMRARDTSGHNSDSGQTTEVATLLMFLLGGYLVIGDKGIAVAIGAIVAVLLYLKPTLHALISHLGEKDTRAIMQFVVIALIILPVLPDKDMGPYAVLNPQEIWSMVALIVGLSLVGYFVYKWVGKSVGTIAGGILGGLISSTATTISYAKSSAGAANSGRLAALVILIASSVSFVRILLEIGVVIPDKLGVIAPPLIALLILMVILCVLLFFRSPTNGHEDIPEPDNPAQLKPALIFGALYGLIILAVAVAKDFFGNEGLYAVSILSGLTDVDAITLSLSNTIKDGGLQAAQGWKLILIAALSNLVFKAGLVGFMGSKQLIRYIWGASIIILAFGVIIILLWPENWMIAF